MIHAKREWVVMAVEIGLLAALVLWGVSQVPGQRADLVGRLSVDALDEVYLDTSGSGGSRDLTLTSPEAGTITLADLVSGEAITALDPDALDGDTVDDDLVDAAIVGAGLTDAQVSNVLTVSADGSVDIAALTANGGDAAGDMIYRTEAGDEPYERLPIGTQGQILRATGLAPALPVWWTPAWGDADVSDTLTVGAGGSVNDAALSASVAHLNAAETITGNWVNTANPWGDDEVVPGLTISGGTINATPIGATTAAAASVTTLSASGVASFDGNLEIGNEAADTVYLYTNQNAGYAQATGLVWTDAPGNMESQSKFIRIDMDHMAHGGYQRVAIMDLYSDTGDTGLYVENIADDGCYIQLDDHLQFSADDASDPSIIYSSAAMSAAIRTNTAGDRDINIVALDDSCLDILCEDEVSTAGLMLRSSNTTAGNYWPDLGAHGDLIVGYPDAYSGSNLNLYENPSGRAVLYGGEENGAVNADEWDDLGAAIEIHGWGSQPDWMFQANGDTLTLYDDPDDFQDPATGAVAVWDDSDTKFTLANGWGLSVTGNTVLGDASGDTLTINPSSITMNNYDWIDAQVGDNLTIASTSNMSTTADMGIGTASPGARLHVVGGASEGDELIRVDQMADYDEPFAHFLGTMDSSAILSNVIDAGIASISSATVAGYVRVEVTESAYTNLIGDELWIPVYTVAFTLPACPRIDAWIDGSWVEVGRAIRDNVGHARQREQTIMIAAPAARFRLVEDEPETSVIRWIRGETHDGRIMDWGLGTVVTEPAPAGHLGETLGDVMTVVEWEFESPVTELVTYGYYIPNPSEQ